MCSRILVIAVMLAMAPLGAKAADLVVWWNEGYYAQEDEAVREIVAAFEQKTGKEVALVLHPEQELPDQLVAAVEAGRPPDFAFSVVNTQHDEQWAYDGRLIDLTDTVGHFTDLFDPDALAAVTLLNATTGRRGLYLLPVGFATHHVHAWKSLLEQAGFTLEDIPKEWEAFWSFWCDRVQPAVREALGRNDVWGTGLTMSVGSNDTINGLNQVMDAYQADYVTRDGQLVIDDPEARRRLIKALDGYTAIYRKGCTPPDSVAWANRDNNEAFLEQTIVMTINQTLSIPNTLKATRPRITTTMPRPSTGPTAPTASRFPSRPSSIAALCSRMGATSTTPRSSCVSWSARAGLPTTSTSPASACCQPCRSCFRRRSGWTRATRIACAPPSNF